jgi:hypothetical protein
VKNTALVLGTIFVALAVMSACNFFKEPVPAEVQFMRDEAKRFEQYTQLVNRIKEDQAATSSFTKLWSESICKKRDQALIALGDRVGCGAPQAAAPQESSTPKPPAPAPKPPDKK